MSDLEPRQLADALLPAVMSAGVVQMRYYEAGVAVEEKADHSPVTAADRESEAVLVAALGAIAPSVPVVAEELTAAGQAPAVGARFFLVDPLDGTREFIKRRGEFTINVALIVERRPVFGIVYAPALGQLYLTTGRSTAMEAQIAPCEDIRRLEQLDLAPMAARAPDPAALVALASRSHQTPETEQFLASYAIASYRQAGSSLKFCAIARGDADIYPRLGPTCEWDTAAGHAVLSAAGGSVTTVDGAPLDYGKGDPRWLNPHFVAWGLGGVIPPVR